MSTLCKRKVVITLQVQEKAKVIHFNDEGDIIRVTAKNVDVGKTQIDSIIKTHWTFLFQQWEKGADTKEQWLKLKCSCCKN